MFETFDHTADLGLRVKAPDLPELFREAGRGLTSILVDNPADVVAKETAEVNLSGTDADYLLFDWLTELLYRFETTGFLASRFDVRLTDEGLSATIAGEPADGDRHQLAHEVKAITYHQLEVTQEGDGWAARLIVDI